MGTLLQKEYNLRTQIIVIKQEDHASVKLSKGKLLNCTEKKQNP